MTVAKIAISVPEDVLKGIRRAVAKGRAASVSAYVTAAVEQKARLDDLEEMLEEMLAETGGTLTVAEETEADRILGVRPRRKRKAGGA
ncbi:MAG TPA: hypothetical protein PLI95_05415 [Polyangiaceae bacterium]|nr:hypothetical protein [Polyangiaceae bacterium]